MNKIFFIPVMAMLLCLSLSSCKKMYVGTKVGYFHPNFCTTYSFPKSCIIDTEHFTFDFTISVTDISGEYVIEGVATYHGQGGFDNLRTGGTNDSRFYILTTKGGEIIDSFMFSLHGSNIGRSLPFKKKFKTDYFDTVGIAYNVVVSG